jgi:hypothetical protein
MRYISRIIILQLHSGLVGNEGKSKKQKSSWTLGAALEHQQLLQAKVAKEY